MPDPIRKAIAIRSFIARAENHLTHPVFGDDDPQASVDAIREGARIPFSTLLVGALVAACQDAGMTHEEIAEMKRSVFLEAAHA